MSTPTTLGFKYGILKRAFCQQAGFVGPRAYEMLPQAVFKSKSYDFLPLCWAQSDAFTLPLIQLPNNTHVRHRQCERWRKNRQDLNSAGNGWTNVRLKLCIFTQTRYMLEIHAYKKRCASTRNTPFMYCFNFILCITFNKRRKWKTHKNAYYSDMSNMPTASTCSHTHTHTHAKILGARDSHSLLWTHRAGVK